MVLLLATYKWIHFSGYDGITKILCFSSESRHALLFEDMGGEFNIPMAAKAKSVREFDDGLTRGMCPYLMEA